MPLIALFALLFFFLLGTAFLSAFEGAFRRLHLQDPPFEIHPEIAGNRFYYRPLHFYFFPKNGYASLLSAILASKTFSQFIYAFTAFSLVHELSFLKEPFTPLFSLIGTTIFLAFSIIVLYIFGEFIPRIIASRFPEGALAFTAFPTCFFMILAFPLTYTCLRWGNSYLSHTSSEEPLIKTKREIAEIIQKAKLKQDIDLNEKKLIESVFRFKDRIAREVMVPRVDVFSLSADTPIKQAAKLIEEEGYSRIPLYRNNVDNIVGVLMYKDVIHQFLECLSKNDPTLLDAPIETIQKGILYTPETKKLSQLLLEFRKRQVHLAIVVDEYGGTEGIVTIEDILEEIVGEIEDEYDDEEEMCFLQPDGSWIVDARMNIIDVEDQIGIKIPEEGDYDTVGGYVFHCAGAIPSKGFIIHQDNFQMEILNSDERKVKKVRITPLTEKPESEDEALYD